MVRVHRGPPLLRNSAIRVQKVASRVVDTASRASTAEVDGGRVHFSVRYLAMPMTTFDLNDVREYLATFKTRQLTAFAAFWAQRLMPMYRRFCTLEEVGGPGEVQACLDLAWLAANGDRAPLSRLNECQKRLVNLAPELEARPILAYAAMECTAATWDALAIVDSKGVDHAIASLRGYKQTIEHFLLNRDHQGVRIATKQPDPLGLAMDPIWRKEVDVLNALLLTLAAQPVPTGETIDRLKAEAENHTVAALVDSMVELSQALGRSKLS